MLGQQLFHHKGHCLQYNNDHKEDLYWTYKKQAQLELNLVIPQLVLVLPKAEPMDDLHSRSLQCGDDVPLVEIHRLLHLYKSVSNY